MSSFENKRKEESKPPSEAKPKQDIGYYRVLGCQKDKAGSTPTPQSKYDKLPAPSFSPFNLFSGEKKEDRATRVKLNYYKQLLQADVKLAEKAFSSHEGRFESLQAEFEEQKGQLTRWGLESLMKNFRMQSWLRQLRGELLMDMSKHIIQMLQLKMGEVSTFLNFLNMKNSDNRDLRLKLDALTDSFYLSPESMLEKDKDYLRKRQRLSAVDKLCHSYSAKFRESLPELNSKDSTVRTQIVTSIVERYAEMLDSKNLCTDNEIALSRSWHEFALWYEQKSHSEMLLYDEYLQFVDDEREREGRLFRRWCNLVQSAFETEVDSAELSSTGEGGSVVAPTKSDEKRTASLASYRQSSIESGNANSAENGDNHGNIEANAYYMMYPKCIQIFIRYFAINIIAATYDIAKKYHSALLALTESVIHRTVHRSLFRYPSVEMKRKDRAWRVHVLRCRYVDPLKYHIAPKYWGVKASPEVDTSSTPPTTLKLHYAEACSRISSDSSVSPASDKSLTSKIASKEISSTSPSTPVSLPSTASSCTPTTPLSSLPTTPEYSPLPSQSRDCKVTPPLLQKNADKKSKSSMAVGAAGEKISSRSKMARSKSASINGLAALGGKNAYCDDVVRSFHCVHTLHERLEYCLASCLHQRSVDIDSKGNCNKIADITSAETTDDDAGIRQHPPIMMNLKPFCQATSNFEKLKYSLPPNTDVLAPYALPARVLGMLQLAVTPRDAIVIILLAVQWLTRTAYELLASANRKKEVLGADDMFPLLVNVLAHANIPCIHLILHYLHSYTVMESFGEAAYYVTSMGAAVEFIDTTYATEKDEDDSDDADENDRDDHEDESSIDISNNEDAGKKEKEFAEAAVNHLGEWLRDQQVMEDTMVVMMQEGWMG